MASGILDVFLIERPGVQLGYVDGLYSYGREQGEEWVRDVLARWPHGDGRQHPPYRRDTIREVVADLSALQPLVSVAVSPEVCPVDAPPKGMVQVRRQDAGDFDTAEELDFDGLTRPKGEDDVVG